MFHADLDLKFSIGDHELPVLHFSHTSGVNQLEEVKLILDARYEVSAPAADACIGQEALFEISGNSADEYRSLQGIIAAATESTEADGLQTLEVRLTSELIRSQYSQHSRTFLEKTLGEILQQIFESASQTLPIIWLHSAETQNLSYCAQYEESDWNFFNRLLAREGLNWLESETPEGRQVSIFSSFTELTLHENRELIFPNAVTLPNTTPQVHHLELKSRVTPARVSTQGYNYLQPSVKIEAFDETEPEQTNEIYAPLVSRPSPERAQEKASLILKAQRMQQRRVIGQCYQAFLYPSQLITIEGHPYEALNQELRLTKVRLTGSQERHFSRNRSAAGAQGCEFEAIFAETQVAPSQAYKKPRVCGLQTAISTGAPGEEIEVDDNGQVHVAFHWDERGAKDHNSSRPIRTAQLPTGGSMLLPRVGWEVTVAYAEGDIEDPVVISRLYNGATMPPYALPENALRTSLQTSTTPNDGSANEIRMSDTKGDEQLFFGASKDMKVNVGNNTTQNIGNDHNVKVGVDQNITVIESVSSSIGANQTINVAGDKKRAVTSQVVESIKGDCDNCISGNLTQMVGGDHRKEVTGNQLQEVSGQFIQMIIGSVTTAVDGDFDHEVGAALIQMSAKDRSLLVAGSKTETTGAAKVIAVKGERSQEVGSLTRTIGGAVIAQVKGDMENKSDLTWSETAGGAQKSEADNISIEADLTLSLTLGGAVITLTPASISISGATLTVDGKLIQTSPLNLNN